MTPKSVETAAKLKRIRHQLRLSQEDLAHQLGVTGIKSTGNDSGTGSK